MTPRIARRTLLSALAAGAAGAVLPVLRRPAAAAGEGAEPTPAERAAMATHARAFMQMYEVRGFSVAVGHAGQIV